MNKFYLLPGKVYASKEPTEITTILGSCVAIALYDPLTKIGGLNHFLLPGSSEPSHQTARYGVFALAELIQQLKECGASISTLQAKVYGGASVLGDMSQNLDVGKRNIKLATSLLEEMKIPVLDKIVGGDEGCRIVFQTDNFMIQHRYFKDSDVNPDVSGFAKVQAKKKCKVLIVDDSATVRSLFEKIFKKHGLQVVGVASNAFEAREMIVQTKPDVMTLDIEMPMMSGVAFLEKIMKHFPVPTVMVSSLGSQGEAALKALDLGAVEFVHKPSQFDVGDLQKLAEDLVDKVRAAANVQVKKHSFESMPQAPSRNSVSRLAKVGANLSLVAVSGNSGSPKSLEILFANLPSDTPPVVVACSTLTFLMDDFIKDMQRKFPNLSFQKAKDGEILKSGYVYLGPAERHFKVKEVGGRLQCNLIAGHAVNSQIPSGTLLFESAALAAPAKSVGILLSGYGIDGIEGLIQMQAAGCFTMAEDPRQLSFPFAPQAAISQGVVDEIHTADKMHEAILKVRNRGAA